MDKTKTDETLSGRPIAKKIVSKMRRHSRGKVVGIKNWVDGRATAEEMRKEIMAQKELSTRDPAFAAYVYPQVQCRSCRNSLRPGEPAGKRWRHHELGVWQAVATLQRRRRLQNPARDLWNSQAAIASGRRPGA